MLRWTDSCIMWLSVSNSTFCILILLLLWKSVASHCNNTSSQPVYGLWNGWFLPLSLVFHLVKHRAFSCKTTHDEDYKSLFCSCCVFVSVTSLQMHRIAVCILNLFFKTVNNINLYCISVFLFDKLLTLQWHVTSGFVFKSEHFNFVVIVRVEHLLA